MNRARGSAPAAGSRPGKAKARGGASGFEEGHQDIVGGRWRWWRAVAEATTTDIDIDHGGRDRRDHQLHEYVESA